MKPGQRMGRETMTNTYMVGNKLFIDTCGFIAVTMKTDQDHTLAVSFLREVSKNHIIQITTNIILSETYTFLRYQNHIELALRFIEQAKKAEKKGQLLVVYSEPILEDKAVDILKKYRDQDISFVDALSLAYLELDNSVKDVFTFDHHFHISGKNILPYK